MVMKEPAEQEQKVVEHKRLAAKLLLAVVLMFGFGYALVPLYNMICEVTGLNGKTGQVSAAEAEGPDLSRTVVVKFVASVNNSAPWEFRPNDTTMEVHPGGIYTTSYHALNLTNRYLVGQATPSVAPREGSLYFNKTECFCFTRQPFEPGEARDLPVQFVIDRDLPEHIQSLVLSYTFFEVTEQS